MNRLDSPPNLKTSPRGEDCRHQKISEFDFLLNVIEKTSAIALGAFSAYTSWKLFVPFFFVGLGVGIYTYIHDKKFCNHAHAVSSCAHGLIEQLTGVRLPRIVSLAANIAVTVCHIDHHETVFVPVIGVSLGAWAGKTASHCGVLMYRKLTFNFASCRA